MTLVFLLEEPSMKAFLEGLLPRLVPGHVEVTLIPHEGKSDLERSIPRKLRAWHAPDAHFVVIRDQDSGDCHAIKERLRARCEEGRRGETLVRIACRELEAWFLADLAAVEQALSVSGLASKQGKEKYRAPDRLGSPSHELAALVPGYGKIAGARALGPVIDIENSRSASFAHLINGVRRLVQEA